jgi:membrane fusion protein (multidrug efflux system)
MSENVVKIVPASEPPDTGTDARTEAKRPPGTPAATNERVEAPGKSAFGRKRLRPILLIAAPLVALLAGTVIYLTGGRYISTDNAYVGAKKVLITPDVSGKVVRIAVHEGDYVRPGDELFTLDPEPYRLALAQAQAKLDAARTDYNKLKTTLGSLTTLADLADKNVRLKKSEVDRKRTLLASRAGSQADVDTAAAGMVAAQLQAQFAKQQRDITLSQLLGEPDLPLERFPEYAQAKAAADEAQRNLDHTVVRAPLAGTATQVDKIQLGRYLAAGTPVFSVIDDKDAWVDANPKETDITWLRAGQPATISVDSFPDHVFHGTVQSVSPGTGAQFSILPPQNASGNWVKVVQRVPVRIVFDKDEDTHLLRSGMSVTVDIETGHSRLPSFFTAAATEKKK